MLGLELRDTSVIALAVDGSGQVVARGEAPTGGDLPSAALAALKAIASAATPATTLGVAALAPDAPDCAKALRAIAAIHAGPFVHAGALPSGTAAAVAEAWMGGGRGASDVVYFSVAEHTTAGIVHDGRPWAGARGRAASAAWLALNPVEREDYRKAGCLEAEVAASGIVRRLVWRIKAGDRSRVQDHVSGDLSAITVDLVLDAARQNDGVSISVMRDTAKYLGMAAANLVSICDPEVLVLGGIMASAADLLLEPVRVELGRRLPSPMMHALRIAPAGLGGDAAAIGAARLSAVAGR